MTLHNLDMNLHGISMDHKMMSEIGLALSLADKSLTGKNPNYEEPDGWQDCCNLIYVETKTYIQNRMDIAYLYGLAVEKMDSNDLGTAVMNHTNSPWNKQREFWDWRQFFLRLTFFPTSRKFWVFYEPTEPEAIAKRIQDSVDKIKNARLVSKW